MYKIVECPLCAEGLDDDLSCGRCGFDYSKRWHGDEHFLNFHYQSELDFDEATLDDTVNEEEIENLYKKL